MLEGTARIGALLHSKGTEFTLGWLGNRTCKMTRVMSTKVAQHMYLRKSSTSLGVRVRCSLSMYEDHDIWQVVVVIYQILQVDPSFQAIIGGVIWGAGVGPLIEEDIPSLSPIRPPIVPFAVYGWDDDH